MERERCSAVSLTDKKDKENKPMGDGLLLGISIYKINGCTLFPFFQMEIERNIPIWKLEKGCTLKRGKRVKLKIKFVLSTDQIISHKFIHVLFFSFSRILFFYIINLLQNFPLVLFNTWASCVSVSWIWIEFASR